jgi:diketogulonate reductase-like aldo/keto reductase
MVEEAAGYAEIFCNQVEYHPYRPQDELLEQAKEMDYRLTAYTPLARGAILKDRTRRKIGGLQQDACAGGAAVANPARKGRRYTKGSERRAP